jgi:hypothetical protein
MSSRPQGARPWTSPRARPGAIDIDFGECSPQPFLALLPDPISFGFGMGAGGCHHREGSVFRVVPPISLTAIDTNCQNIIPILHQQLTI